MKLYHLTILFVFAVQCLVAQNKENNIPFMTGLLPDDGTYDQLPLKANLLTRDYENLPSSYSLKNYCPESKSQNIYGTCVAWSTAYAARTISEAIKNSWTNKEQITEEAFSPLFVYAMIKYPNDYACEMGGQIYNALDVMKKYGTPKFSDFDVLCADNIDNHLLELAKNYTIDDYTTLFRSYAEIDRVKKVKKSLSEGNPVVIAMHLPISFTEADKVWESSPIDEEYGYHAMCVVGYDNDINGGSFEIMNSWGPIWGDKGFVWVTYSDFSEYVDQAYEVYVKKTIPNPESKYNFSGDIYLQLATGEIMPVIKKESSVYSTTNTYISGTRYRVYLSNNEPAYVYIIGSDLNNNITRIFPPKEDISAALNYKSNHIAIPNEKYYIELDDTPGTDYLCVLYSQEELNLSQIIKDLKSSEGTFYQRLTSVLNDRLVPYTDVIYKKDKIQFNASSKYSTLPIIIELNHTK